MTGTPISRGLEDVFGLMAFLGAQPWASRRWWARCVQRPVEAGEGPGRALLLALLQPVQRGQGRGEEDDRPVGRDGGDAVGTVQRPVGQGGGEMAVEAPQRPVGQDVREAAGTAERPVGQGFTGRSGVRLGLMWRSAKRDVEGELGLPPQGCSVGRLRLSAVELHFYNRQHQVGRRGGGGNGKAAK